MNKLMKMNECMNEWKKERMNEWMSQSMNELMNQWNQRMNKMNWMKWMNNVRIKWKELNEWIMSE